MQDKELVKYAMDMMAYAHVPYSKFTVGAALLCEDGTVYGGCNVEGSSFGNTICAERTALVKAVSEGKKKFKAIAVAASCDDICSPCGICRQFLADFGKDIRVLCANRNGEYIVKTIDELLPMAFTGEALNA